MSQTLSPTFPTLGNCIVGLMVVLVTAGVCNAQSPVPESRITSLQAELSAGLNQKTPIEIRMACKELIRNGKSVIEANSTAPNRFRVMGIVFQAQKRLIGLESNDRNRADLFDTCQQLSQAPDEYASLRLEADLLLSEKDLSAKEASLQERTQALMAIIQRYRGTPAEAKSLMMAAMIAPKLEATELQDDIYEALNDRFSSDPEVIEFIQKNLGVRRLDVVFTGAFTRVDGTVIRFPYDRMGHLSVLVFWSRQTPGVEQYLKQIKEQQATYGERIEVYSFNIDELPDAGESILRGFDLNWTVMRLPGGRKSQTFQTYVQKDLLSILVNAYGHAVLAPTVVRLDTLKIDDVRISEDRYLAQLQSIFIGDFLVSDSSAAFDPAVPPEMKMISVGPEATLPSGLARTTKSVPDETLREIQACFIASPFRCRLKSADAIANYAKAEKLCAEAIGKFADAPNLWIVRNRRIVALLGLWNLSREPKYLEQAVNESRSALSTDCPPAAGVVARFCLAKQAFRDNAEKPEAVLASLIRDSGADHAPASALAAATILALEANAKDLHELYRSKLMASPYDGNPALWSFISFLRDRYHRYHLFKGNLTRSEDRGIRPYIVNFGAPPSKDRLPDIEFLTLEGRKFALPKDANGQLTLLVFVEPPDVIKKVVELDAKGKPKKKSTGSILDTALNLAESHVNKDLKVVPAFLCDDPAKVKQMIEAEEWNCDAVMVPGGLANPMVQRLGINPVDRIANVFLLRRDGTIAWQTSGLRYKADFSQDYAVYLAMKVQTEVCEAEYGYEALRQGDFKKAATVFSGPFPPDKGDRFHWAGPRFYGRALANVGLKQWDAALADIDVAIKAHNDGDSKPGPCKIMADMRLLRATILDQLGRKDEATAERKSAAVVSTTHPESPYRLFEEKLSALKHE